MTSSIRHFSHADTSWLRTAVSAAASLRLSVGAGLHPHLVALAQNGQTQGLVLADLSSAGLVGDALAANNGSSKYLRGAYIPLAAAALSRQPAATRLQAVADFTDTVRDFVRTRALPGDLILGNLACLNDPNELLVFVGTQQALTVYSFQDPCLHQLVRQRAHLQQFAALTTLYALGLHCDAAYQTSMRQSIGAIALEAVPPPQPSELSGQVQHVTQLNQKLGRKIFALMQDTQHHGVAIGESFTFGKLAALFNQAETAAQYVDFLYGWYDAAYKVTVGVPAAHVTDELIAEPETVRLAAQGLLAHAPGRHRTAIATSGWANYWKPNAADYFSVSVLDRTEVEASAYTARVTVHASQRAPLNAVRRELTRQLGVTTALCLLGLCLQEHYPLHASRLPNFQAAHNSAMAVLAALAQVQWDIPNR